MQDLRLSRELLVTSEYKEDEVLNCICGTFSEKRWKAVSAYSRLCELLLLKGKTLSEYTFLLAVNSGTLLNECDITDMNSTAYRNFRHDIEILSAFAAVKCDDITDGLRERFGILNDTDFPVFETGDTVISAETVIKYKNRFGSSLFAENKAFIYGTDGLTPVRFFDRIRLSDLKNYETQRDALVSNTLCFINGRRYSSALLYGDRGTGKSSTVKAAVNEFPELRVILVPKEMILRLYDIYETVRTIPLKFVLFIDDLMFSGDEPEYTFLKQALEGSVNVMPQNCVIYATTNRRHIVKETYSERADEHNAADAREEKVSLADRFGLYITFMLPDKKAYLDIVKKIAADRKLGIDEDELITFAERFALRKGGRSPRTARQAVDKLESGLDKGITA